MNNNINRLILEICYIDIYTIEYKLLTNRIKIIHELIYR